MSSRRERPGLNRPLRKILAVGLSLVTMVMVAPAGALPDDRDQPIRIEADEALRDEKQGFTRYRGNVRLNQGSLQIEGDQITVYHDDQQADRVLAEGQPASMQQQPDPEKGPVKARANIIEYFKSEERVQLRQNAHIEQDGSIVTGDTIDYFINEQLVKADSDKSRGDSRVQVVIPAQAIQRESEDSGTPDSE